MTHPPHPPQPRLSLMVIRVADLERSARFYSAFGLQWVREQHGNGPVHYSTSLGNTVLELYPASKSWPVTALHIGLTVADLEQVLAALQAEGGEITAQPQRSPWGLRAVINDPDGHRIELTQT